MESEPKPSVVTVVVTFNGLADTLRCIGSLLATTYPRQQIVVVDNGSSGEADAIEARFGRQVLTIASGRNLGFGGGANRGIEHALEEGADYVWVLNNDVVVEPETLGQLIDAMEQDTRIGIASPVITAPRGPEAPQGIWYAGGRLDLRRGETRHLTELIEPPEARGGPLDTEFVTGCAALLRGQAIESVGPFWERLFLYWEDTDLNLRLRRAGWRTCVVPQARLHHAIHGATSQRVVAYYHFRNATLVVWRHAGLSTAGLASGHLAYTVARRWASAALGRRAAPLPETRGLLAGVGTVLRWSFAAPPDTRLPPVARDSREAEPRTGRRQRTPPRILHVVRRFAPLLGGTETYVRDLAEAQTRLGHDVTVLTLDHDVTGVQRGRLPAREDREGVRIVRLPGLGGRRFAITGRPWRLVGEIVRADVVHIHDIRFMTATICVAARLRGQRVVAHTHGLIFHTQWAFGLKRFLMRYYYGPVLRLTGAAIVASSTPDRDALLELAPYLRKRTVLLENAIRLEGLMALQRAPIPGQILAFGRVARSKSLDSLIEALAAVTGHEWQLQFAGTEEADERERLEQIASRLGLAGRIRFTGTYSDKEFHELLEAADLAVFPSSGEGFGLALLEAMAAGVPAIANDIPAHRALLGPDLEGNLTDFSVPAKAGSDIEHLLDTSPDGKVALGELERRRAEEYDISRLVREVEALYGSLGVRS